MKSKYLNRHKILKTLYKKRIKEESPNTINTVELSLTFSQIAINSNLPEAKIIEQIEFLINEKEISKIEESFDTYYFITDKGSISYHDEKYLDNGEKEFWTTSYDIIKTISTLVLLIMAVIVFILNFLDTKQNKKDIDVIKTELQNIKDSSQQIR